MFLHSPAVTTFVIVIAVINRHRLHAFTKHVLVQIRRVYHLRCLQVSIIGFVWELIECNASEVLLKEGAVPFQVVHLLDTHPVRLLSHMQRVILNLIQPHPRHIRHDEPNPFRLHPINARGKTRQHRINAAATASAGFVLGGVSGLRDEFVDGGILCLQEFRVELYYFVVVGKEFGGGKFAYPEFFEDVVFGVGSFDVGVVSLGGEGGVVVVVVVVVGDGGGRRRGGRIRGG
mmetsp:Transcript_4945/g.6213  ORF Transcript_4945/g.6213 Transcript_4945/m.6213 type:complete len:232 (-) Transcript_4945:300-995(-)